MNTFIEFAHGSYRVHWRHAGYWYAMDWLTLDLAQAFKELLCSG